MAKELNFRKTPDLLFIYDEANARGNKIDAIIEELKKERETWEENKEEE